MRPSSSNSATPSAVRPKGSPIAGRVSTVPAALNPNVKFAPIAACTAWMPPTSTSRTKSSAGTRENAAVNGSTTSTSMPIASINDALRSTVVSSRGS